ncbi:MAG: hypothetical protein LBE12_10710 [Planctomycetaceae bacterium]|jgi:hypothetical protein|nr:hypothetical protein [Planctomycetaceae bacterium]
MSEKFLSLLKKNPIAIKEGLSDILDQKSLDQIQNEINKNVKELFLLGVNHYNFAKTINSNDWRHKISRLYYAAYNIARSVRLHTFGYYSTDSEDHKRIGDLPKDFPNQTRYATSLVDLRDDRNISDYDHTAKIEDTKLGINDAYSLVEDFLKDADQYFKNKNVTI